MKSQKRNKKLICRVCLIKSTEQKIVTIPKTSYIKADDYVWIEKVEDNNE